MRAQLDARGDDGPCSWQHRLHETGREMGKKRVERNYAEVRSGGEG